MQSTKYIADLQQGDFQMNELFSCQGLDALHAWAPIQYKEDILPV